MTSNEHGAIEQNVEHHETNNLTYYTRESELHARSYALRNKSTFCEIKDLEKNRVSGKVNLGVLSIGSGRGASTGSSPAMERGRRRRRGSDVEKRRRGGVAGGGEGGARGGEGGRRVAGVGRGGAGGGCVRRGARSGLGFVCGCNSGCPHIYR